MKILKSLPAKLLIGLLLGMVVGLFAPEGLMTVIVTAKYIMGQVITFCVPLIVIGFIAPSITKLGTSASRMLTVALILAYASSILAAFMSMGAGYAIIPSLNIASNVDGLKDLPPVAFELNIPQIMPVMSALVFSVLIGLAAVWTKSTTTIRLLADGNYVSVTGEPGEERIDVQKWYMEHPLEQSSSVVAKPSLRRRIFGAFGKKS